MLVFEADTRKAEIVLCQRLSLHGDTHFSDFERQQKLCIALAVEAMRGEKKLPRPEPYGKVVGLVGRIIEFHLGTGIASGHTIGIRL